MAATTLLSRAGVHDPFGPFANASVVGRLDIRRTYDGWKPCSALRADNAIINLKVERALNELGGGRGPHAQECSRERAAPA